MTINRVDVRSNDSELGQKHIYAQEHQLYYYFNKFKDHIFEQKLKISLKTGHLK